MATIGEMTGGRDGFSCERPVINSRDWRNIEKIAEEEDEKDVNPSAKRVNQKFRHRRN